MSLPYTKFETPFSAAVLTATATLSGEICRFCPTKVFEIITTGFSGTLDIQGRISPATTLDNVSYVRLNQSSAQQATNDQLSYTTDTGRYRYISTEPHFDMALVMTRSAGSITVHVAGWGGMLPSGPVVSAGQLITLFASAARTVSANGTAVTGLGFHNRYIVLFDLTVADTDAGDTLDVYVDVSLDGTTWLNAVHFTQIVGTDAASKRYAVLDPAAPGTSEILVTSDAAAAAVRPSMFGPQMRGRCAIVDAGADDASFTFSVVAYAI